MRRSAPILMRRAATSRSTSRSKAPDAPIACCDSLESQHAIDSLKTRAILRKTTIRFFAARPSERSGVLRAAPRHADDFGRPNEAHRQVRRAEPARDDHLALAFGVEAIHVALDA